MQAWSLGQEDPLEEGMVTHSSILAWRIPRAEEFGSLQSIESQRVGRDWNYLAHSHTKSSGYTESNGNFSQINNYLLNAYYVPGIALDASGTEASPKFIPQTLIFLAIKSNS